MTTEHRFHSTGEAYDDCQCRDDIETGDVLIIERERVVGVADAWPMAVTLEHGNLHTLFHHATYESVAREITDGRGPKLLAGFYAAVEVAKRLGYAVRDNPKERP